MLVYSIPPHRLFFSQGRSGHRFLGVISKFAAWTIFSANQTFAIQPLPWFACLVAATCIQSTQLFDLVFTGFGTPLFGRCSKYPPRTLLCAVQMWCSSHCMDLLALPAAILPAIITTLRFGANSVWATVFRATSKYCSWQYLCHSKV